MLRQGGGHDVLAGVSPESRHAWRFRGAVTLPQKKGIKPHKGKFRFTCWNPGKGKGLSRGARVSDTRSGLETRRKEAIKGLKPPHCNVWNSCPGGTLRRFVRGREIGAVH